MNPKICSALAFGCLVTGFATGAWVWPRLPHNQASSRYMLKFDYNGDGKSDVIYHYSDEILLKAQMDRDFDGVLDYVEYYSNNIPSRAIADDRFDSIPTTWFDFSRGQVAVVKEDRDSNGVPDVVHYYTNGLISTSYYQPNGTGDLLRSSFYTNGWLREDSLLENRGPAKSSRIHYDIYGRRVMDGAPQ